MSHEIAEGIPDGKGVIILGIQQGGAHLAKWLATILQGLWGMPVPQGTLDVSMHRDDLDEGGTLVVRSPVIPRDIQGQLVILVDDVLFSGRTTRAALDALNDFGRPKRVFLAVLIDRGHRQLPIQPDYVGKKMTTTLTETIEVHVGATPSESWVRKNCD